MNKHQRYTERLKAAQLLRCEYKLTKEDKAEFDKLYAQSDSFRIRSTTMRQKRVKQDGKI